MFPQYKACSVPFQVSMRSMCSNDMSACKILVQFYNFMPHLLILRPLLGLRH